MAITRSDKENLKKSKRAEIQQLKYQKGLLIDQKRPSKTIAEIEAKIALAQQELKAIQTLPEKDYNAETNINILGGIVNQVNTGINLGNVTQNNLLNGKIDFEKLENELSRLHTQMKKLSKTDDHDIAVGEIAKAKKAAKEKNKAKVFEYLKSAGEWALDVATKMGTSLAIEALKIALGI